MELFRLREESSSTNAVVCTDLIHKVSEFINSSVVNSWFKSPLFFSLYSLLETVDKSGHIRCLAKLCRDVAVTLNVNYLVNSMVE